MATLSEKMKTMTGYCSCCGTRIISDDGRPLENYCDHTIEVSVDENIENNRLLKVGICVACKALLVAGDKKEATAKKILANHKVYWKANKRFAPEGTLTMRNPNGSESSLIRRKLLSRKISV